MLLSGGDDDDDINWKRRDVARYENTLQIVLEG